jgi:diaminohydroxyphosphoribosylaminopyrimidine deaminase/5-amino-6-(5-phosphoribosylamino)uracil reductase
MSAPVAFDDADRAWMEQALALAALGEGRTSPNPRVGCVLVRDGRVVGAGFHRAHGEPHAERVAVTHAGERARNATAYVTLEPCAHHGLTPPCADLLVERGVRRVVASLRDPNPLVNGSGFDRLRAAGIRVDVGLLANVAYALNEPFLHRHHCGRPVVTIKAAMSADGLLSAAEGRSRWVTGAPARTFAHRLRLRHDAVLVGGGTVRRDDPRLTVRLAGLRATRLRVVLSARLDVDPDASVFGPETEGAPLPRIYTSVETEGGRIERFAGRAEIARIATRDGRLALDEMVVDLARRGVQSVLVEGGGHTIGRFLEAGLADRVALFVAPRLFGAGGATPLVDLPSVHDPTGSWRIERVRQLALGDDSLLLGHLRAA